MKKTPYWTLFLCEESIKENSPFVMPDQIRHLPLEPHY